MQIAEPITAEQYLAMDLEDQRTQLIDGSIVVNEPRLRHQILHVRLLATLHAWVQETEGRGLVVSPLDVRLDDRNVYASDLLWYRAEHTPTIDAPWPYPLPDLAVEIRSPSTWRYGIGTKKRTRGAGAPRALACRWRRRRAARVSPLDAHTSTFDVALELDRSGTLTSPLLHGFALHVGELFNLG